MKKSSFVCQQNLKPKSLICMVLDVKIWAKHTCLAWKVFKNWLKSTFSFQRYRFAFFKYKKKRTHFNFLTSKSGAKILNFAWFLDVTIWAKNTRLVWKVHKKWLKKYIFVPEIRICILEICKKNWSKHTCLVFKVFKNWLKMYVFYPEIWIWILQI